MNYSKTISGGYIIDSKVSKLIKQINLRRGKTNHILTGGAGCLFLGTTNIGTEKDNIRVLCGLDTKNKISSFGGLCHKTASENSLRCALRETIEELFCIKPLPVELDNIEAYLELNWDEKYIFVNRTYVFDISTLGDFVEKMYDINPTPANKYLNDTYVRTGYFSISGPSVDYNDKTNKFKKTHMGRTFDIVNFMKHRNDFLFALKTPGFLGTNKIAYVEIRWLSFPSLVNIMSSPIKYNLLNTISNKRELHPYRDIFEKFILIDLKKECSDFF